MNITGFSIVEKDNVPLISVDCINKTGLFRAYYSTGMGGVSSMPGNCSMNLNIFKSNDSKENARENFRRFALAAGVKSGFNKLVAQHEIHSSIIYRVTKKDYKRDILDNRAYKDADGQVTGDNIPLFVYAADCATLMLVDPSTGLYATTHCGWKNSLNNTIQNWIRLFATMGGKTDNAIVAIGPSLCQKCFEVDDDVRMLFLNYDSSFKKYMCRLGEKTHINLNGINGELLVREGINESNIYISDICNNEKLQLPSFRRDKGNNGVLGGILYRL